MPEAIKLPSATVDDTDQSCCGDTRCKPTDKGKGIDKCGMTEDTVVDTCCAPVSPEPVCKKGCCGGSEQKQPVEDLTSRSLAKNQCDSRREANDDSSVHKCAASKSTESPGEDGCCSVPDPSPCETTVSNRPSCCEGKGLPCCDTSCLDRIALRECESGSFRTRPKRSDSRGMYRPIDYRDTSSSHPQARLDLVSITSPIAPVKEPRTAKHVVIIRARLEKASQLLWMLSAAFVVLCWLLDKRLAVCLQADFPVDYNLRARRRPFPNVAPLIVAAPRA